MSYTKEKMREYMQKYRQKPENKTEEWKREHRPDVVKRRNLHRDKFYQDNKKRRCDAVKDSQVRERIIVLQYYSQGFMCCELCKEDNIDVLTIDHILGNGASHRKKLGGKNSSGHKTYHWLIKNGFPSGFRILCRNCNWKEKLRLQNFTSLKT